MTYQVKIEIFEGPLDLLLHLIQKDDLEIYDIPISKITSEYLQYLDLLKELNLNVAGEFLVMAATLMQIKSQTLLPVEPAQGEEEGPDPRADLIQKLLEYQKFKEISKILDGKMETQRNIYYRGAPIFEREDQTLEVSLSALLDAFSGVLETARADVREILVEEIPVEVKIREILNVLENRDYVNFSDLFPKNATRRILIITFLALLELIRLKQIRVTQTAVMGEIHIQKVMEPQVSLATLPEGDQ